MILFLLFALAILIGIAIYFFAFRKRRPMLLVRLPTPPPIPPGPPVPPTPPMPTTTI